MIIVPEIETVIILVPRTGSTALKRAVMAKYQLAFTPYRHMEADGVPFAYERWRKVGVARPPLARLWSVYRYCKTLRDDAPHWLPGRSTMMQASTAMPFEEWLRVNETVFATAEGPQGDWRPRYAVKHPMPENRKSQRIYLRPDLGTEIYHMRDLSELARSLGVSLERCNEAPEMEAPYRIKLNSDISAALGWDRAVTGSWW